MIRAILRHGPLHGEMVGCEGAPDVIRRAYGKSGPFGASCHEYHATGETVAGRKVYEYRPECWRQCNTVKKPACKACHVRSACMRATLADTPKEIRQMIAMGDAHGCAVWFAARIAKGIDDAEAIIEEARSKPWRPAHLREEIAVVLGEA